MNDDPREFVFTRYEARHGMAWLVQAYALFSSRQEGALKVAIRVA